jgi:hypothetical protein
MDRENRGRSHQADLSRFASLDAELLRNVHGFPPHQADLSRFAYRKEGELWSVSRETELIEGIEWIGKTVDVPEKTGVN